MGAENENLFVEILTKIDSFIECTGEWGYNLRYSLNL